MKKQKFLKYFGQTAKTFFFICLIAQVYRETGWATATAIGYYPIRMEIISWFKLIKGHGA